MVNETTQRMTIQATSKENDYSNVLIRSTSKAGTWELLINYFKQYYGNECTAVGNLSGHGDLSSHSEWKQTGIKSTMPSLQNRSRCAQSAII